MSYEAQTLKVVDLFKRLLTNRQISEQTGIPLTTVAFMIRREKRKGGFLEGIVRRSVGFHTMSAEERKRLAVLGGKAAHEKGVAHRYTAEEAKVAGRKGGINSARKREERLRKQYGLCDTVTVPNGVITEGKEQDSHV